jgi:uncharacterized protein (DUF4415 family)
MTGLDNVTKADHAPSDMEKQEIVAATARHRERAPRVAVNIRQPEDAAVKISPTHSDGQGWEARLKDALGTTSQAFLEKQEIVAATARHRERAPRVAVNIRQPEDAAVKISPTHSDGQGWEARLKDALGTTSQAFLDTELLRLLNCFCDQTWKSRRSSPRLHDTGNGRRASQSIFGNLKMPR